MAAPTISSVEFSGGNISVTGTGLEQHSDPPSVSVDTFNVVTSNFKGSPQSSIVELEGGLFADFVASNNQYYEATGNTSITGSLTFATIAEFKNGTGAWINGQEKDVTLTNGADYAVLKFSANTIHVRLFNSSPSVFKGVITDSAVSDGIHTMVVTWDNSSSGNMPKIYIDGSLVAVSNTATASFTTLNPQSDHKRVNATLLEGAPTNQYNHKVLQDVVYNGLWSAQEITDYSDQTFWYKKIGGSGSLVPVTPTSTTSTTAELSGFGETDTVHVFKVAGYTSSAVTDTDVNFMTFNDGSTDLFVELPYQGYKSVINMLRKPSPKKSGKINFWDSGTTYDRYTVSCEILLTASETTTFLDYFSVTNRDSDVTLTPNGDFFPFTPLRGNTPNFVVRVSNIKQSGSLMKGGYKHFKIGFDMQFVDTAWPSYSLPSTRSQGTLQIGTIGGLRYPIDGFKQEITYNINTVNQMGFNQKTVDWDSDAFNVSFELTLESSKMGALLNYLVTNRNSDITIIGDTDQFVFGNQKLNSGTYTARCLNTEFEVLHQSYDRFTLSTKWQWRATA